MKDLLMVSYRNANGWVFFWVFICGLAWSVALGILFSGCTYESSGSADPEPVRVTFLDVGQGLAVLLENGGRFALYDTGPDSVGVVDSLLARGFDSLSWVLLSHGHRDHVGGFLEMGAAVMAGRLHVGRLLVGPDTASTAISDSVLVLARRFGLRVDTLVRGDSVWFSDCLNLSVQWPPEYGRFGENRASVVVKASLDQESEASLLLTGDLDSLGERLLLELSPKLSAELLQVGHHGSSGSNSLPFLSQVSPRYAAIGVGKGNRYGHPTAEVLRKLELVTGDSAAVFRTDLHGSFAFEMWPNVGVVTR
jgi:competence protein ComEC